MKRLASHTCNLQLVSPFDADVGFAVVDTETSISFSDIHPEETALISPDAVASSRQAFLGGRLAARQALLSAGLSCPPAVLRGARGEPLWPEGYRGSISHASGCAVAAAASTSTIAAIGLDLEPRNRVVSPAIARRVCSPEEAEWVAQTGEPDPVRLLSIFSAKESVYKTFAPIKKRFFGFDAVTLTWNAESDRFEAELKEGMGPKFQRGYRFEVQVGGDDRYILTSTAIYTR